MPSPPTPSNMFGNYPHTPKQDSRVVQPANCNDQPELGEFGAHTHSLPGDATALSWPSCPQLFEPHVYTLPSCSRNSECCPPHATSFSPLPLNTWQFLGSNTGFLSTPIPNCPSLAFPQHSMVVKGEEMSTSLKRRRESDGQMEEDNNIQAWEQPRFLLFM